MKTTAAHPSIETVIKKGFRIGAINQSLSEDQIPIAVLLEKTIIAEKHHRTEVGSHAMIVRSLDKIEIHVKTIHALITPNPGKRAQEADSIEATPDSKIAVDLLEAISLATQDFLEIEAPSLTKKATIKSSSTQETIAGDSISLAV